MPIARVTGALGNTSCLVGTPEQVARAILEYYKLGVGSILVRGFNPFNDTVEFGRELIPRIKAGAAEILIPEPVRHLLAGKGYTYVDRGETMLKGFDDAVRLYSILWRA